jgi:hypothetical protein
MGSRVKISITTASIDVINKMSRHDCQGMPGIKNHRFTRKEWAQLGSFFDISGTVRILQSQKVLHDSSSDDPKGVCLLFRVFSSLQEMNVPQ